MPFQVAISGLRAASQDLNVIANNIANAGTTGFKRSRAEFADVYAVSSTGVAGNSAGAGVNLQRVAQQFSQGNIAFTDNGLDLAISGEGFFVLDDNGAEIYTRAGAFGLDRQNFVVNAENQRLVAFSADASGNITGATAPLQINQATLSPSATTGVDLGLDLDSSAAAPVAAFSPTDPTSYNNSTSTTIYDSLGSSHLATFYYRKTASNSWETYTYVDGVQVGGPNALQFNSNGALIAPATGTFAVPAFNPGGGASNISMTLDYSGTTQFGPFSVNSLVQDGFTTGRLSGLDIDSQGVIFARYTNGQSLVQGQVALANFANQQGLQPLGETSWAETFSSGSALLGAPGSSSLGLLQAGALEDPNIELSQELVDMIVAQRNYQANAEVISTADAITQTIINIR
jgi:flagellar hook protein FlgE